MWHIGLWAVVVAFAAFGHLYAAALAMATKECVCCRVCCRHAVHDDEIVVEAHNKRVGDSTPASLLVAAHVVFATADVHLHGACLRRIDAEVCSSLAVHAREVIAVDGSLRQYGIFRHIKWRAHLIAHQRQHLLAIATSHLAIAGSIEMQVVSGIGAALG